MTTETVTILRCAGGYRACKIFSAEKTLPYDAGSIFTVTRQPLDDLRQFHGVLSSLENNDAAFLIRGDLRDGVASGAAVWRRCIGEGAPFREHVTRLFCVDIDGLEAPDNVDPCSVEAVQYAISKLPSEFHNSDCVAQFSSSAGTLASGRKIKLHLWFWGSRPYSDVELRRWAERTDLADPKLYNPVQPHYTAKPIFRGVADPFAGRSRIHFIEKRGPTVSVVLPDLALYASCPRAISSADRRLLSADSSGKIIDGRETLLRDIRWSVLHDGHCATCDDFTGKVWRSFSEQAELGATPVSGNIYDYEKIARLCASDWAKHGATIPEPVRATMPPAEATAKLEAELAAALARNGVTVVKATAGLGKTTATARLLFQNGHAGTKRVDVFAPTHKEQKQWGDVLQQEAAAAGISARIEIIEGRNSTNCIQHEAASILGKAGLPATEYLCRSGVRKCRAYETCPYLRQFSEKGPVIRIYNHGHLSTPTPVPLAKSDMVIIDEAFHNSTVEITEGIKPFDFKTAGLRGGSFNIGRSQNEIVKFTELRDVGNAVAAAIESGHPILEQLRARGITPESLINAADTLGTLVRHPRIGPDSGLDAIKREIRRTVPWRERRVRQALSQLSVELSTARADCHSIDFATGEIRLHSRKSIMRRCDVDTVVILDADAEPVILRAHFPDITVVEVEASLSAEIVQVDDLSFSRRWLGLNQGQVPEMAKIEKLVSAISKVAKCGLLVTYRNLISHLEPLLPCMKYAYFGNLRGTNDYKHLNSVFIVGRHFIPYRAVEDAARALFWDAEEPLQLGQPICRRHQVGQGVLKSYDELDYRPQAIRRASREAETRQALARLRLVHAENPKRVYLFSSQPIGVPVDRLIQFESPKGVRLFDRFGGYLPYGAEELAKMAPDEFADPDAARKWRDRPENTPEAIKKHLMRAGVIVAETTYKRRAQRGRPSRMLLDPLRHPKPELTIAATLSVPGEAPLEIAPLPWVDESSPAFPSWLSVYRLRSQPRHQVRAPQRSRKVRGRNG